jgi:tRNA pseudouridine65 synthase
LKIPEIPVLYRDDWLAVVHKPAGLLVFPGPEAPDRDTCLSRLCRQLGQRVQPCHRLDRGTSGALLLSFDSEVTRALSCAFQDRQITKRYWAVARGFVDRESICLDYPLEERAAISHVRGIQHYRLPFIIGKYPTSRYSLVEVRPHSGRRHQVRLHLRHLRHPIVGDIRHGDSLHNRWLYQLFGWKRLALAAMEIGFKHPVTSLPVTVECPLSGEFQAFLEQLEEYQVLTI